MKKNEDIRALSDEELEALKEEKRKEIFDFRNARAASDKEVKPHFIRENKKALARILTIQTERTVANRGS